MTSAGREMEHFNWALDWFDAELARGPLANQAALTIVGDGAASLTFAELSERSNRVANGLRALGVKRGDRMLLMLGNVAPLWEDDAGRHEAGRRRHSRDHPAHAGRSRRPLRAWTGAPCGGRRR